MPHWAGEGTGSHLGGGHTIEVLPQHPPHVLPGVRGHLVLEEEGELAALPDAVEVAVHLVVLAACGHSPLGVSLPELARAQGTVLGMGKCGRPGGWQLGKGHFPCDGIPVRTCIPPHLQEVLGHLAPLWPNTEAYDNGRLAPSPTPNTESSRGSRAGDPGQGILMVCPQGQPLPRKPPVTTSPLESLGAACPQTLFRWPQACWPSALPPPTSTLLWAENKQNRRD